VKTRPLARKPNYTHALVLTSSVLSVWLLTANKAWAHASEQAFVLLLPTGVYIGTGVFAVVATIALLAFLPVAWTHRLLSARTLWHNKNADQFAAPVALKLPGNHSDVDSASDAKTNIDSVFQTSDLISIASTIFLIGLLGLGLAGAHDPLENPLPLFIWTLWWIGFVIVQGVIGDIWRWMNPWTGCYRLLRSKWNHLACFSLPKGLGVWPAVIALVLFMLFALADIAPDAPTRLTAFVGFYWLFTFLAMCLFGERWLAQAECFTVLLNRYAQLAIVGSFKGAVKLGFPGWLALAKPTVTISGAVFILVLLGTGSFDGFNETFYWLGLIGVNPLEFPGRSAVIMPTVLGLITANLLLIGVYSACVYAGLHLANRAAEGGIRVSFHSAFCQLAIAVLPIAFAYHFAHFLTAFMVNSQYALAAASDPLDTGADLLGLGTFYVTTGFMNSHHTVEAIWLTQAVAVVFGHVLSVLLAHALALGLFDSARRAIISQVPLAAFMVLYTFIGLWLLAAPRGA